MREKSQSMFTLSILINVACGLLLACSGGDGEGKTLARDGAVSDGPVGGPNCNNGVTDSDEMCEGFDLRGKTCLSEGFEAGTLACTSACTLDTSDCSRDANPLTCNDDSELEPNESIGDPTVIQDGVPLVGLAICPASDQDVFIFSIGVSSGVTVVEVQYESDLGELEVEILNGTGGAIATGTPVMGDSNLLRAAIPNLPTGTYFARVRGANTAIENNYNIGIDFTAL